MSNLRYPELTKDDRPLVIYHGECPDGFCAAYIAWKKFNRQVDCVGWYYTGDPNNVPSAEMVRDKIVYIIDFHFSLEAMERINQSAKFVQLIDHHITAKDKLHTLDYCYFDMERSGASLAWDYFHNQGVTSAIRPWYVNYVEDRDLWHNKLINTHAVSSAISSWPFDFEYWNTEITLRGLSEVTLDGKAILRYKNQVVQTAIRNYRVVNWDGYQVAVINYQGPSCVSEILHWLVSNVEAYTQDPKGTEYHKVDFSLAYYKNKDGKYSYSLRSRGDFDVSFVAGMYGGGGHVAAAGFTHDELLV